MNYLADDEPLEFKMGVLFQDLGVSRENKRAIESFLAPLRDKGEVYNYHYQHSIRVALLCVEVARFMHLDQKALFYAGLLHDIGKAQVPAGTLGKTSGWTENDTRNMRPHVMDGYRLIRDRFDFSAEVILWHHKFQKNGYPVVTPKPLHGYCLGTKMMIQLYGRILSLCDQFDAFHRVNDRNGERSIPTGEEIKSLMFRANPDQKTLLDELYKSQIFTTFTKVE